MLFFNNINIPLAIFTVVLRRFIDKFRAAQVEVSFAYTAAGWVLRNPLVKPLICGYLFVAGIRYALKHFRNGNMVTLTRRNLRNHNTITNRKKKLGRKKSWVLNNLASNRESQEKVLRYVASLTPPRPESRRIPDDSSPCESNFDLGNFASNPYYTPRCSMRNNDGNTSSNCSIVSAKPDETLRKQSSKLTFPTTYYEPRSSIRDNNGTSSSNCSIGSGKPDETLRKKSSKITCPTEYDTPVKASTPYYEPRSSIRNNDGTTSSNCSIVSAKADESLRKQTSKLTFTTPYYEARRSIRNNDGNTSSNCSIGFTKPDESLRNQTPKLTSPIPYYKPRRSIRRNDGTSSSNCSVVSVKPDETLRKQTSKLTCPTEYDTPLKPSDSLESLYGSIRGTSCPSELSGMPTSLNILDDEPKKEKKRRTFQERALELRRRNIRDDRSSGSEQTYRKTRSGRIYGTSVAKKLNSR